MNKIIVIGGGAAGMMAAIKAAENGSEVLLLEKMKRAGKKMLITGKGRCNLTNRAEIPELIKNMTGNGSFLHSTIRSFDNDAVIDFFEAKGVPVKVERGGRVFPVSDQAADIVSALTETMYQLGVEVRMKAAVKRILTEADKVCGVELEDGNIVAADAVILAAGGASYPATGSDGDGAKLAAATGHTVVPLRPSLVPLEVEEEWIKEVQGLSLRNVRLTALADGEKMEEEFGEMMFAHFGVTGPVILSLSRQIAAALDKKSFVEIVINLKPALTPEVLDRRVQRDFEKFIRKQLKNAMHDLLPSKLIQPVLDLAYLDGEKEVHQVTREERIRLVAVLQHLTLTVTRTRPLAEAIVTAGGVSIKEIHPKTMESKLVKHLYFAGEVIDVDGYTGGYNLQAAFSTGAAAGQYAAWAE